MKFQSDIPGLVRLALAQGEIIVPADRARTYNGATVPVMPSRDDRRSAFDEYREQIRASAADRLWRAIDDWRAGRIDPIDLNRVLTDTWGLVQWPLREAGVGKRELVRMFRFAGFVTDVPGDPLPMQTIQVYRGATREAALGFSWTPDCRLASRFALASRAWSDEALLLETAILPGQVLGALGAYRPHPLTWEVIVNPLTLRWRSIDVTSAGDASVIADAAEYEALLENHLRMQMQEFISKRLIDARIRMNKLSHDIRVSQVTKQK